MKEGAYVVNYSMVNAPPGAFYSQPKPPPPQILSAEVSGGNTLSSAVGVGKYPLTAEAIEIMGRNPGNSDKPEENWNKLAVEQSDGELFSLLLLPN